MNPDPSDFQNIFGQTHKSLFHKAPRLTKCCTLPECEKCANAGCGVGGQGKTSAWFPIALIFNQVVGKGPNAFWQQTLAWHNKVHW